MQKKDFLEMGKCRINNKKAEREIHSGKPIPTEKQILEIKILVQTAE